MVVRIGNTWEKIIAFENLLAAARLAQQSKRYRPNVLAFNAEREKNLIKLQDELIEQTYHPGQYRSFRITDPKPRLISAAPYRDRVVHHALCQIIVPVIERTFIFDSYANRTGFGTHRALKRFTHFARHNRYVLQCDICQYFPSIDHEILKRALHHKLKCPDTLALIDLIIDSSNPQDPVSNYYPGDDLLTPLQRRQGLPIGNLTSQFFANVFLDGFDHFIKEKLKIKQYLRYVDDFALFSDDKAILQQARQAIEAYLTTLRLKIHPIKSQLFATAHGANFVGYRVLPDRIRVRSDNLQRGRQRLQGLQRDLEAGLVSESEFEQRLIAWFAHLSHADSHHLRQKILKSMSRLS
jgi:retron-type reverse transcriptase